MTTYPFYFLADTMAAVQNFVFQDGQSLGDPVKVDLIDDTTDQNYPILGIKLTNTVVTIPPRFAEYNYILFKVVQDHTATVVDLNYSGITTVYLDLNLQSGFYQYAATNIDMTNEADYTTKYDLLNVTTKTLFKWSQALNQQAFDDGFNGLFTIGHKKH